MLKIMLYIGMTVLKHSYLELAKHCGDFIVVELSLQPFF